jgi:hypothetical protein
MQHAAGKERLTDGRTSPKRGTFNTVSGIDPHVDAEPPAIEKAPQIGVGSLAVSCGDVQRDRLCGAKQLVSRVAIDAARLAFSDGLTRVRESDTLPTSDRLD